MSSQTLAQLYPDPFGGSDCPYSEFMRNNQVARILTLIVILDRNPRGLTVPEMCRALETRGIRVSPRTIYRDIDALDRAGLPLLGAADEESFNAVARWRFTHGLKVLRASQDFQKPLDSSSCKSINQERS